MTKIKAQRPTKGKPDMKALDEIIDILGDCTRKLNKLYNKLERDPKYQMSKRWYKQLKLLCLKKAVTKFVEIDKADTTSDWKWRIGRFKQKWNFSNKVFKNSVKSVGRYLKSHYKSR